MTVDDLAFDDHDEEEILVGEVTSQVRAGSESALGAAERQENTRSRFALYYVVGFLAIISASTLISFYLLATSAMKFDDFTNILVTLSGILSGPLGFIIGYYFKAESNRQ